MRNSRLISIIIICSMLGSLFAQLAVDSEASIFTISVSVVGSIEQAGIYKLPPGSRLSEVVKMALTESCLQKVEELPIEEEENANKYEYSLRNIALRRNGKELSIDLQQYLLLGKPEANPVLQDKDIVYIPACSSEIHIYGEVHKSGSYEFRSGDRISDLIELALGLRLSARKDSASLVRLDFQTGQLQQIEFSPRAALGNPDTEADIKLQPGDRIYLRPMKNYNADYSITIEGMVNHPGEYAIEEGKTRLLDVLHQSGGPKSDGSLTRAYLQRYTERDSSVIYDPELERLSNMTNSAMSLLEAEYYKLRLREMEGKITVDFAELWSGKCDEDNILLQDGDYIYIPRIIDMVEVSGAVNSPGFYKYVPGKNYSYYIELAGQYTNSADKRKLRIIREESSVWLKRDDEIIIQEGDMVFVPEKEEIDYWLRTKDAFSIAAQLATIILAIQSIYSN